MTPESITPEIIFDMSAYLGPYPFRRLSSTTAAARIEQMDAHGIDYALVSSLPAVFYRDAQQGDEQLFTEVADHQNRLLPVATVNPKYVGWQHDLEQALKTPRLTALALWPEHHGYRLNDEHGQAALRAAAEHRLPVVLTQRLEDRRQRHHWDQANDLTVASLTEAAAVDPKLKFVLRNWVGLSGGAIRDAGLTNRCLIDFSRLQVLMTKDVPKLIETLGPQPIAYGSHTPFDYYGPSLVKLANLQALYPQDYSKFAWQNAARFFELELTPAAKTS